MKSNITQLDLNELKRIKQIEEFIQGRLSHINQFTTKDTLDGYIQKSIEENAEANELRTKLALRLKKKIPLVENKDLRKQLVDQYKLVKGLDKKQKEQDKKLASLTPDSNPEVDLDKELKGFEEEEEKEKEKKEKQKQKMAEALQRIATIEKKKLAESEKKKVIETESEKNHLAEANQRLILTNQVLAEAQQKQNQNQLEETQQRLVVANQVLAETQQILAEALQKQKQQIEAEAEAKRRVAEAEQVLAEAEAEKKQKQIAEARRRLAIAEQILAEAEAKRREAEVEARRREARRREAEAKQREAELVEKDYECQWTQPDRDLTSIDNFIEACQILQISDIQFYLKKDAEVVLNTAYESQKRNDCYKNNEGKVKKNVDAAYRFLQASLASAKQIPKSSDQLIYDRNCINPALSPNNYEEAKLILGLGPQVENLLAKKSYRLAKMALDNVYKNRLKDCVDNQSITLDTAVRLENKTKLLAARQRILHNIEEMEIARPPMEPMEMGEDVNRQPEGFEEVALDPSGRQADSDSLADFDPLGPSAPGSSSIRRVPRESYPLDSELGALSSDIDALGDIISTSSAPPRARPGSGVGPVGVPGSGVPGSGGPPTYAQTIIQMIILAKNILNIRSERGVTRSELLNNKNKLLYIIKNNITPIPDKLEEKVNTAFKFLFQIPENLTKDPQNKQKEIDKYVDKLNPTDKQYLSRLMLTLLDRNYVYKKLNFDNSRIILHPRINNRTIKNISENVCEDIGQLTPLIASQRLFPSQIRKLTRKARYKDINKNVNARYQKAEKEIEKVKTAKDEEAAKQIQAQLSLLETLENDAKSTNNEDIKRRIRFNTRKLEELNETLDDLDGHLFDDERKDLDKIISNTKNLKKELELQLVRNKQGGNKHFTRKLNKKIKINIK